MKFHADPNNPEYWQKKRAREAEIAKKFIQSIPDKSHPEVTIAVQKFREMWLGGPLAPEMRRLSRMMMAYRGFFLTLNSEPDGKPVDTIEDLGVYVYFDPPSGTYYPGSQYWPDNFRAKNLNNAYIGVKMLSEGVPFDQVVRKGYA